MRARRRPRDKVASRAGLWRRLRLVALVLGAMAVALLGLRIHDTQRGPPLELWHTFIPPELDIAALDQADWPAWMAAEQRAFDAVRTQVTEQLEPKDRAPVNRYFAGSAIHPPGFAQDFNRSYVLLPEVPLAGAVVLLHGLTDSPYSLRHIGLRYRAHGFAVVAIRLPGHGTVPAGLTDVAFEDWQAATRLAMREARRLAGADRPVHLVGFSNGGALAMKHALDAIEDPALPKAERIVLLSPMVGITAFARFAGLAGLPALLPRFAKAAWLAVLPEFNPFKYNSFPVNGARQSWRATQALQGQINRLAQDGRLAQLPPILTFQSVMDFTVSTRAIIDQLYVRLPANGSELVLIDLNRNAKLGPLLRPSSETVLERLLPPPPRRFRTTIIANEAPGFSTVVARVTEAGATSEQVLDLGLSYPADVFSLSHVALPFPTWDALYGAEPNEPVDFGIQLGAVAARGERGALIVNLDALLRMSSNPFYPYVQDRIEQMIGQPAPAR